MADWNDLKKGNEGNNITKFMRSNMKNLNVGMDWITLITLLTTKSPDSDSKIEIGKFLSSSKVRNKTKNVFSDRDWDAGTSIQAIPTQPTTLAGSH